MIPLNIDLPKAHQLVKLSPDLYWGRLPLPFRLNHINLYIIDTKDGWVIIDAGIYGEQTSDYWRTLLDGFLSEKPIDKIIITHHHVDHIGFASELVQMTGAPCFTTDAEQAHGEFLFNLSADQMSELISSTYMRYGLHESEIEFGRRDSQRYKRYVPELPIFDQLSLDDAINGCHSKWKCRIDSGHSSGQLSFINYDERLFLPTDFLLPRISPNISADIRNSDKDVLGDYLTYLNEMTALPADIKIFPGHDWPFTNGNERALSLIEHHNQRLNLLLSAAKEKPISTSDGIDILFNRRFESHEIFFASGESRAHLTHLMHQGKLEKTTEIRSGYEVDIFIA